MTTGSAKAPHTPFGLPVFLIAGPSMFALAVVGVFYATSGLLAPAWAAWLLVLFWLGLVGLSIAWCRRHPLWLIPLPLVAGVVWMVVITVGERHLGWTG